jgi:hypothetical protein
MRLPVTKVSGVFGCVFNGRIGDSSIPLDNTVVYNGTINYTAVENSRIVSSNYGLSNTSKKFTGKMVYLTQESLVMRD